MSSPKFITRCFEKTGFSRLLEFASWQRVVLVLNYHRIGDSSLERFDRAVYTCTTDEFDRQLAVLCKRLPVISTEELIRPQKSRRRQACALMTFDDGYLDNYTQAFPILKAHGVPAVFFLATSLVGSSTLSWWDQVAYVVRHSKRDAITIDWPAANTIPLGLNRKGATDDVLSLFKKAPSGDPSNFVRHVSERAEIPIPQEGDRRFLNWQEACEMQSAGMEFGSHTHTHRLLSALPYAEQLTELTTSREIMERELARPINTLAYPIGSRTSFNTDTRRAVRECGYSLGFSFYGGVNNSNKLCPTDVRRFTPAHPENLRVQLALATSIGRERL